MWQPLPTLGSIALSVFGIGWAGVIRSGRRLGCRLRSPSARRVSGSFSLARMRWTGIFNPQRPRPTCRCVWACLTFGTATSTALAAAASRPTTARCAAGPPICSSWRWRATASASTRRARRLALARRRCCGARAEPTASMRISRCCTRGATGCRSSLWRCASPATTCRATMRCCWPTRWRRRRR